MMTLAFPMITIRKLFGARTWTALIVKFKYGTGKDYPDPGSRCRIGRYAPANALPSPAVSQQISEFIARTDLRATEYKQLPKERTLLRAAERCAGCSQQLGDSPEQTRCR